jgi:hypothetical protein
VRERVRVVLRAVRATRAGAVYGDADGTVRTRWIRARTALFTMCRGARRAWRVECGSSTSDRTICVVRRRIASMVLCRPLSVRPVRCPDLAGPQYTRDEPATTT